MIYLMSTKHRIFLRLHQRDKNNNYLQKGVLYLSKVQHQNGHDNTVSDRFLQFGHNQSQAALSLGQAELPLHFLPVTFVLEILRPATDLIFLRSAQSGAKKPDTALCAKSQVLPVPVDLIRLNLDGIIPSRSRNRFAITGRFSASL